MSRDCYELLSSSRCLRRSPPFNPYITPIHFPSFLLLLGFFSSKQQNENASKSDLICSKCRARHVERKEAIIELVQTETNYSNDLLVLKEVFQLCVLEDEQLSHVLFRNRYGKHTVYTLFGNTNRSYFLFNKLRNFVLFYSCCVLGVLHSHAIRKYCQSRAPGSHFPQLTGNVSTSFYKFIL